MNKGKIYGLMDLATKLMVINFLWFLTLLTGMVVLTIFPATAALFITVKKQMEDSLAYKEITKIFLEAMFKNFAKFSLFGIILVLYFLTLSSNFIFIFNFIHIPIVNYVLQPIMIFLALIGLIVGVNAFMINGYETLNLKQLLIRSIKLGLLLPFNGLMRALILGIVAIVVFIVPGLLPIISMNVVAVLCLWIFPKPIK